MLRSMLSKVIWVERATVFIVGLSVIVGLAFGLTSVAFGASAFSLLCRGPLVQGLATGLWASLL